MTTGTGMGTGTGTGTRRERSAVETRVARHQAAAIVLYAVLAVVTCLFASLAGHHVAWLALLAVPVAVTGRARPVIMGTALVVGGAFLRVVFLAFPETNDQIAVTRAAAAVAFSGGNPYGIGYAETIPPGAPYPYGPLGLLTAPGGVWLEVVAAVGTMVLIARTRSWITLAVYASAVLFVRLGTAGVNDVSAGLAITGGLLALRQHRLVGGALLGVAAGLKPYALAWFAPAVGYGGLQTLAALALVTLAAWSPAIVWGPASVLRSVELARSVHPVPQNSFNAPELRLLAVPIAAGSLLARRWDVAVLAGAAIFLIVLYFDRWASLGYLLAVLPIVGIAVETTVTRRRPTEEVRMT